jgi:N-acetylglucosaminyl-diphospho-decaprenol L-rhamnosyltransferase
MPPSVSVIIVTHNSAAVLPGCLASISRHLTSAEIIVVDNASEDDSVHIATRHPGTRVLQGHGNVGYGSGVNLGAGVAAHQLLLVMNPDATLLAVDGPPLKRLAQAPTAGIRACRREGRHQPGVLPAWAWRTELHWWMFAWFLLPSELPMPRPKPRPGQARWVNGAAFAVRRDEFLSLGGFDESFFLYFEDFDLCRTYRLRELPVDTTDAFVVSHAHAQSSPRDEERMMAYALLGLIEYAAKSDQAAEAAAAYCLRLLRGLARAGRAVSAIPVLGRRAAKKRISAEQVRRILEAGDEDMVPEGRYGVARAAIAAVRRPAPPDPIPR